MINSFYTCLANQSAASLASSAGVDIIDANFIPVVRHDAVDSLANLVFSGSLDHSLMMYARAKQAVLSTPVKLLMDRTSLYQGYSVDDLTNYFWQILTVPRIANTVLKYMGKFMTPLYMVHAFKVVIEGAETVLYSSSNAQLDRQTTSSGEYTSLKVMEGSETMVLVPTVDTPASFVWASRPSVSLHNLLKDNWSLITGLCNQIAYLDSVLPVSAVIRLVDNLNYNNSSAALAGISALIAGHTAKLAQIEL